MGQEYKLIAFDLDGTVLDHEGRMLIGTGQALLKAHRRGCTIAVSTGRPEMIIPEFVKKLPFLRYLISASGAIIIDLEKGEVLSTKYIDGATAAAIYRTGKAKGANVNVCYADRQYMELGTMLRYQRHMRAAKKKMPGLKKMLRMLGGTTLVLDSGRQLKKNEGLILKMECVYKTLQMMESQARALGRMPGIEPATTMGNTVEITAKGATKGEAIAFVAGCMGIHSSQVMVFGDSGNDLSMRAHAGCFVAMGNASADVKAVADYVTSDVDEDGVGKALHRLLDL